MVVSWRKEVSAVNNSTKNKLNRIRRIQKSSSTFINVIMPCETITWININAGRYEKTGISHELITSYNREKQRQVVLPSNISGVGDLYSSTCDFFKYNAIFWRYTYHRCIHVNIRWFNIAPVKVKENSYKRRASGDGWSYVMLWLRKVHLMLVIPLILILFQSKGHAKISSEGKIFVRAKFFWKILVDSLMQCDKCDCVMIENKVMDLFYVTVHCSSPDCKTPMHLIFFRYIKDVLSFSGPWSLQKMNQTPL